VIFESFKSIWFQNVAASDSEVILEHLVLSLFADKGKTYQYSSTLYVNLNHVVANEK